MTKEEYIEFTNLQSHFEWLHAAEDRAKTKLETFKTDDSEFDELIREAVKVYFETEIDKAWKKIEEFKTATAKGFTGIVKIKTEVTKSESYLLTNQKPGYDNYISSCCGTVQTLIPFTYKEPLTKTYKIENGKPKISSVLDKLDTILFTKDDFKSVDDVQKFLNSVDPGSAYIVEEVD